MMMMMMMMMQINNVEVSLCLRKNCNDFEIASKTETDFETKIAGKKTIHNTAIIMITCKNS